MDTGMDIPGGYAGKGTAGTGTDTLFCTRYRTRTHTRQTRTHRAGFVTWKSCAFYIFFIFLISYLSQFNNNHWHITSHNDNNDAITTRIHHHHHHHASDERGSRRVASWASGVYLFYVYLILQLIVDIDYNYNYELRQKWAQTTHLLSFGLLVSDFFFSFLFY